MPLKGVELEVNEGITEHSSRVALKGVFSNFGDVVACWVPPIDRRGQDNASVRFAEAASAEAAFNACAAGQVFLQGMQVKCLWRTGGGRRVGNSDLGAEAGGDESRAALRDKDRGGGRRSRSRGRRDGRGRRSRSRGRRSRSRRRRSSPMKALAGPDATAPADPNALPDWLQGAEPPAAGQPLALTGGAGIPPPSAFTNAAPPAPGGFGSVAFEPEAAPMVVVDPEEELRRRAVIEAKRKERAEQAKKAPGVAALVQAALQRARVQPTQPQKEQPANGPYKDKYQGPQTYQVDAESEDEDEETAMARKAEEEAKRRLEEEEENRLLQEREEFLREERVKAEKEREKLELQRRERRERAAREAAEAETALQRREAETREQRIKASVEAAKRQQAERAAAKAAKEAADSLYDDMPQPDIASEKMQNEVRMKEAAQREKTNKLSNLPPEDRSKVIFLDVDGVLRPARAGGFDILSVDDSATRVDTSDFFPSAMKALRHIVEKTGASIVLSSEWRRSEALCSALGDTFDKHRLRAWGGTTGTTLELEAGSDPLKSFADRRAREITSWLQEHEKTVNGWLVLDDINIAIADEAKKAKVGQNAADKSTIGPRLVQTWPLCGLTMGNAKTAVRILNGEMINKVVVERPVAPVSGAGGMGAGMATPMPKAAGLVGGAASVIPGRTRLL